MFHGRLLKVNIIKKMLVFLVVKVGLHITFFYPVSIIHFGVIRIFYRMGLSPLLLIIHTVTLCTMLNNNSGYNGHGLKMLPVNRPLMRQGETSI